MPKNKLIPRQAQPDLVLWMIASLGILCGCLQWVHASPPAGRTEAKATIKPVNQKAIKDPKKPTTLPTKKAINKPSQALRTRMLKDILRRIANPNVHKNIAKPGILRKRPKPPVRFMAYINAKTSHKKPMGACPYKRVKPPTAPSKLCGFWKLCHKGQRHACLALSRRHKASPKAKAQFETMIRRLDIRCTAKEAGTCERLLTLYKSGIAGKKQYKKMFDYALIICRRDTKQCTQAKRIYRQMLLRARNKQAIYRLQDRACKGGIGDVCYTLANEELLVTENRLLALRRRIQFLNQACERQHRRACYTLALQSLLGMDAPKRPAHAHKLLIQSCEKKHEPSCILLAHLFATGHTVPTMPAVSHYLLATSCQRGENEACIRQITPINRTNSHKSPAIKVPTLIKKYVEQLHVGLRLECAANKANACLHLGHFHALKTTIPSLSSDPVEAFGRACLSNNQSGCTWALLFTQKPHAASVASFNLFHKELHTQCTKQREPTACYWLGTWAAKGEWESKSWFWHPSFRQPSPKQAAAYFATGCELGLGQACLARYTLVPASKKQTKQAIEWAKQACNDNNGPGCRILADSLKSVPDAIKHWKRGCEQLDPQACFVLATRFPHINLRFGPFAPLAFACQANHPVACQHRLQSLLKIPFAQRSPTQRTALRQLCTEQKQSIACLSFAQTEIHAPSSVDAYRQARALLKQECKKNPKYCTTWSKMAYYGFGGPIQTKAASLFLKAACNKGNKNACALWGQKAVWFPNTTNEAAQLLRKACKQKHLFSCYAYWKAESSQLSHACKIWSEMGHTCSESQLLPMFQQAAAKVSSTCQTTFRAPRCYYLAKVHQSGPDLLHAPGKAKALLKAGCNLRHAASCAGLAELIVKRNRYDRKAMMKKFAYQRHACSLGHGPSCLQAANFRLEAWRRKQGSIRYYKKYKYNSYKRYLKNARHFSQKMRKLFRRACVFGQAKACMTLGTFYTKQKKYLYIVKPSKKQAQKWFREACHRNHAEGCWKALEQSEPLQNSKWKEGVLLRGCALHKHKKHCP